MAILSALMSTAVLGAGAAVEATVPPSPIEPAPADPAETAPPATEAPAPTTTLPAPPPGTFNPDCVWVVRPGDSVSLVAGRAGSTLSAMLNENFLGDDAVIQPGDLLDMCPGNGVSDVTGASLIRPDTTLIANHDRDAVRAQQEHLNNLFGVYGMSPLAVDGQSGRLTRQQLCAARVMLGLPVSRSDMAAGSEEEARFLAAQAVDVPPAAPRDGGHWALIDITCQVMFVGDQHAVRFVLPVSTGEAGFETREVTGVRAFRFEPAAHNNGWHDSSEFPSAFDNPRNGNMYKPIYFHNGQAIHGAGNVPTSPASKGCVRLTVDNQNKLLDFLGLGELNELTWKESVINLRVSTHGSYLPDP